MRPRIAYYAHHHGSGHAQHALDLADTVDCDLLILSSRDIDISSYSSAQYVKLPDDIVQNHNEPKSSLFHYAPNDRKISQRHTLLANELLRFGPDFVIVDVSVEIATLCKLLGYPVVYRLMHGDRTDIPHQNVYQLSDHIVAYFSSALSPSLPGDLRNKLTYVGMRRPHISSKPSTIAHTICLMTSTGGDGIDFDSLSYACSTTPDWTWTVIGKVSGIDDHTHTLPKSCHYIGMVEDPDAYLSEAEVIVSSAGHNAVARSLAHRKPLVLVPERRPFDEQVDFAAHLSQRHGIEAVYDPKNTDWPQLLRHISEQKIDFDDLLVDDVIYGNNFLQVVEAVRQSRQ